MRQVGRVHCALSLLLVLISHLHEAGGSFWSEPSGCFWRTGFIPCFQSWDLTWTQRKGDASMMSWSSVFGALLVHGQLALEQQAADGVVFQVVYPKWTREWEHTQEFISLQHPGTSSLPRQESACSILPSIIPEGAHLLPSLGKGALPWEGAFMVCLFLVLPSQVQLWHHIFQWVTWGN